MGAQFGGEVVDYEKGLSFVTFHGSGHMVPQFRPQAALHFLQRFLESDALLSPLMPSNQTLAKLDDKEFSSTMNEWTESAMKAPYVLPDLISEQFSARNTNSPIHQTVEMAMHLH
jgi:cathepsin A (carboxypeptidase C)